MKEKIAKFRTEKDKIIKNLEADFSKKMSRMEEANKEEVELFRSKYQETQKQLNDTQLKLESAKDLLKSARKEKMNISNELKETRKTMSKENIEQMKKEIVKISTENRRLTTNLSFADNKLR